MPGNMNRAIPCFLVICLLFADGCSCRNGQDSGAPQSQLTTPEPLNSDTAAPSAAVVPDRVLAAIPHRIESLKTGMGESQVIDALGLTPYWHSLMGHGGGSAESHWTAYQFRPEGCILVLSFDCTAGWESGKFLSATLSGKGWPTHRTMTGNQ